MKEDVTITEEGSLHVGTSDARVSDSYALRFRANNKILSLSGDISLYSNTTAYGVDFGTNSGKLILGNKALKITANGTGVAYGLVLKDLEFEKEGSDSHLTITATGSSAYGIYNTNNISEEFNWDVTASGTSTAYALHGEALNFTKGFSGKLKSSTSTVSGGTSHAMSGTSLTVAEDMTGSLTATGYGVVRGVSVTGNLTIGKDFSTAISTTANYYYYYTYAYGSTHSVGYMRGISGAVLSVGGNFSGLINTTNNAYYTARRHQGISGNACVGDFFFHKN